MIATIRLALRNLSRNRRRTLATLVAIALGSTSVLLFGGFTANIKLSLQTGYVRTVGHVQLQHRDYHLFGSGNPASYAVRDYEPLIRRLKSDPELAPLLRIVTPVMQFGGVAGNYEAGVSRTVIGTGLVADDHVLLRQWNQHELELVSPPMQLAGTRENSAVLGVGLARVLQLCKPLHITQCPTPEKEAPASGADIPADIAALGSLTGQAASDTANGTQAGSTVELLASTVRGAPNVATLNAIHAENQGFKELDEVAVMMHLSQAQKLVFSRSTPAATAILIQLHDTRHIPRVLKRLEAVLPEWSPEQPLVARDFAFLNPFYEQSLQLFDTIFGFMFALIGSIVMFTVANTMNTAVVERTVEIGTIRAMGVRQNGVRRLFVTEGLSLGLAGALAGVVLALLVAASINAAGLSWRPPASADPVPLTLKVWGEPGLVVGTSVALVILTTISAWIPARRGARLNIVEALRHA